MSEMRIDNVRPRSTRLDKLARLSPSAGTVIYPNVYVSDAVYQSLHHGELDPRHVALLLHEQTHVDRMRAYGVGKWYAQYLLSPAFRLNEELEATVPQFTYLKAAGVEIDLEHRAKLLSGSTYLWPTTYEVAYDQLDAIWLSCAAHAEPPEH